ncbi:MAG: hypothetical protein QM703_26650 [Gemmatales bacterium]
MLVDSPTVAMHVTRKGGMEEMFSRGWHELIARDSGPLHFRLILQPLVAMLFAIRSGLRDAREGRPAFFWTVVLDGQHRRDHVRNMWKDVGKLFLVAITLDVIYQIMVLRWFYPIQMFIVAAMLALVPYLLVRGLTNRFASRLRSAKPRDEKES